MSPKRHKTNKKGHKSPKKGHKKSPKKSPQNRRTDAVNDNPVSPSLGDANAFNFLLQKHASAVEVLILSSYSHILLS